VLIPKLDPPGFGLANFKRLLGGLKVEIFPNTRWLAILASFLTKFARSGNVTTLHFLLYGIFG
jgi:hypothetical protein